jgi:hypothetical protein
VRVDLGILRAVSYRLLRSIHASVKGYQLKKIFICYRTADEPYAAVLMDEVLSPHFGSDGVFRASRSIKVGEPFEKKIFEVIRDARAFLVVIGPKWLDARDANGRRLDDPDDMVRREIIAAFEHGVPVIPVLVNTPGRLRPEDLPAELVRLTECQDVRVNFRNSEYDLPALVERLKRALNPAVEPATRTLLVVAADRHAAGQGTPRWRRVVVEKMTAAAGIGRDEVSVEDHDGAVVAVTDADPLNLLEVGPDALTVALRQHDAIEDRPRVGVHRGTVGRDEHGWSGAGLDHVLGLVDAPQVERLLARTRRARCAFVVSDPLYREFVVNGRGDLDPKAYARLDDPVGWVRVPGYPKPPVAEPESPAPVVLPALPPLPAGTNVGNLFQGNSIAQVDASVRLVRETD